MDMRRLAMIASVLVIGSTGLMGQTPPTPTNLVAQNVSNEEPTVSLMWQTRPGSWNYRIYRSQGDSSHFEREGWSSMPSFHDHEVLLNHTYYYYVTSVVFQETTIVESQRSNIAGVTVSTSHPNATIAGTVTADVNGEPIANVNIRVFRLNLQPYWSAPTITNQNGQYLVQVDTGAYFIKAEPSLNPQQYAPEWYNNAPDPSHATPIHIATGDTSTADFSLSSTSPISMVFANGRVNDEDGHPLQNASIVFMRTMQEMNYLATATGQTPGLGSEEQVIPGLGYTRGVIGWGQTDQFGLYHILVVAGGSYIVAAARPGFLTEYYNNHYDPTEADIITVANDTSGLDFTLREYPDAQNSVRGVVRDSSGQPVPSRVILFPKPPGTQPPPTTRVVHSDSLGNFLFTHVSAGVYDALAVPYSNFTPSFYKENSFGVIHWQEADSIIAAGLVSDINIGSVLIQSPGLVRITGTVTGSNGGPIPGGRVVARTIDGITVGYGVSDATGTYAMDAVPTGEITVLGDRMGFASAQGTVVVPQNTYVVNSNLILGSNGTTSVTGQSARPYIFELDQSFPNPFNPTTTIRYSIPERSRVVLKVFNVIGQEVATLVDAVEDGGFKSVRFDASALTSGLYFYRLEAEGSVEVMKMLLLK